MSDYSIPHRLSEQETSDFFARQSANPILQDYLLRQQPPSGVIIEDGYGQILVWFDASQRLHVIDVTNMAIAAEVQKGIYTSDPEYLEAVTSALKQLVTVSLDFSFVAILAIAAYFLWPYLRGRQ